MGPSGVDSSGYRNPVVSGCLQVLKWHILYCVSVRNVKEANFHQRPKSFSMCALVDLCTQGTLNLEIYLHLNHLLVIHWLMTVLPSLQILVLPSLQILVLPSLQILVLPSLQILGCGLMPSQQAKCVADWCGWGIEGCCHYGRGVAILVSSSVHLLKANAKSATFERCEQLPCMPT